MKEKFSPSLIERMESAERREQLPPGLLLQALKIGSDMTVLDVGAGTGYFSFPAATLTSGQVVAADPQAEMIGYMQAKAAEEQVHNLQPVLASAERLPLPDRSVDRAIASLVLHVTDTVEQPVQELARVMKPGGLLFILEWMKKEDEARVPPPSRVEPQEMEELLIRYGFKTVRLDYPTDRHYRMISEREMDR
ncbi:MULTISPECIES: class I SAM-dependent methyltransferase [unclassified Paenibacillus]|uniref:class I SAM-dependent methyltransferase n=1 Tax=unclassified Paenibacillus TaxID=185978 RepID=UPI000955D4EF|nr:MULTISPECIES: class I SAM-dependent methyltransferase [unclassified Paenibacillus]ASS65464.1 class I SAM-dependent methyltransferase [Paenibacillus sp. RUD330]SIQ35374.1 Methyltransferase domain-containing protein [Paenibacillus sp. RU4X]SIQ57272.1 Methyltransferase domain-containing protein [Paenibacillus sp. RU4T]